MRLEMRINCQQPQYSHLINSVQKYYQGSFKQWTPVFKVAHIRRIKAEFFSNEGS
jgi:hypothetical protein